MKNTTVDPAWLKEHLSDDDIVILDASLEATISGGKPAFDDRVIPGARQFDIKNNFSDLTGPFPNTVPAPAQFEMECQKLGINNNSKIVVYDTMGIYSSPRAWWLFRVMGHQNVAVLDGGLPLWIKLGFLTESAHSNDFKEGNFRANFQEHLVKSYEEVLSNTVSQEFLVVDARSEGRFKGTAPEPRKQLQSGHILNSINLPFEDVLENGQFKSKNDLKALFQQKVVDGYENLVYSCGSGLTACIIMLAGQIAYTDSPVIYDGSWTEWAEKQGLFT